jgi:hypothetical protein
MRFSKEKAFENIKEIIEKNPKSRILIAVDSIGKEELMVRIAEYFQTIVLFIFLTFSLNENLLKRSL